MKSRNALSRLGIIWGHWLAAACLPVPFLIAVNPVDRGETGCIYFGIACAYLAITVMRAGGLPASTSEWWSRMGSIAIACVVDLAVFILTGIAFHVKTNLSFPIMAGLSAVPAIGLVPWLMLRLRKPLPAMVFGAVLVLCAKLFGCVVARFYYGAQYDEQTHVANDWTTAKLMICVFWAGVILESLAALIAAHRRLRTLSSDSYCHPV